METVLTLQNHSKGFEDPPGSVNGILGTAALVSHTTVTCLIRLQRLCGPSVTVFYVLLSNSVWYITLKY